MLRYKEILPDKWLFCALHFFRIYRNELLHKCKTDDLAEADDVGVRAFAEKGDSAKTNKN